MFDSVYVRGGPSHISASVKVDEHRAPTDESVKLLQDLEKKAQERILGGINLDNHLKVVGLEVETNIMFGRRDLLMAFNLNGEKYRITVPVSDHFLDSPQTAARRLVDSMGKAAAEQIFERMVSTSDFGKVVRK